MAWHGTAGVGIVECVLMTNGTAVVVPLFQAVRASHCTFLAQGKRGPKMHAVLARVSMEIFLRFREWQPNAA